MESTQDSNTFFNLISMIVVNLKYKCVSIQYLLGFIPDWLQERKRADKLYTNSFPIYVMG